MGASFGFSVYLGGHVLFATVLALCIAGFILWMENEWPGTV